MIRNLILLKFKFIKNIFSRFGRYLYWYLRLVKSTLGNNVKIHFPVIVEGNGRLIIGDNCELKKRSIFGLTSGSTIEIQNGSRIHEQANIHAGKNTIIKLGENCSILTHSILRNGKGVEMEKSSSISSYCNIFPREAGYDGKFILGEGSNVGDFTTIDTSEDVIIGKYVALGPYNIIYTHDHDYRSDSFAAWKGGVKTGKVFIEDGAWVGARVILLPGITIGKRAIVAAGSVVTKNVAPGDIVGGIPAKSLLKKEK